MSDPITSLATAIGMGLPSPRVTPIFAATLAMSHRSSWAAMARNPEFRDTAVKRMGVPTKPPAPPKLPIRVPDVFTQSPVQEFVILGNTRFTPLTTSLTERPCSSQSTRVKILNVDPAENPAELPNCSSPAYTSDE